MTASNGAARKTSALRDMRVIARREFLERVRSKWFVAITLLGPIGMLALVLVPALLAARSVHGAKIDIVDRAPASQTAPLGKALADELREEHWQPNLVAADTSDAAELARIADKSINGFVVIPADVLDGGVIGYYGDNVSNQGFVAVLYKHILGVVQRARGAQRGVDAKLLAGILEPPKFIPQQTTGRAEGTSGLGSFAIGYFLAFILYIAITLYGVGVMRSVVQEKTSRVMELMVATVKPHALMAGKIVGVGGAGLVQLLVWLAMGGITLAYRELILGLFGVTGSGPGLPPLELSAIAIVVVYFILGFFFYASLYAAVGAMVSSEQDTQQVQMPVTMLIVLAMVSVPMVINDPRGTAAQIMTIVPFWSAPLMPMRFFMGGASLGELALSLGLLLISTVIAARAAARIYRVGVLMYGKRPSLGELARWLRY
jgi:ABC-2 type transport system permease protein